MSERIFLLLILVGTLLYTRDLNQSAAAPAATTVSAPMAAPVHASETPLSLVMATTSPTVEYDSIMFDEPTSTVNLLAADRQVPLDIMFADARKNYLDNLYLAVGAAGMCEKATTSYLLKECKASDIEAEYKKGWPVIWHRNAYTYSTPSSKIYERWEEDEVFETWILCTYELGCATKHLGTSFALYTKHKK